VTPGAIPVCAGAGTAPNEVVVKTHNTGITNFKVALAIFTILPFSAQEQQSKVDRGLISVLRKLIAIALLAVFGLPFASTLFALTPKSESNLPACCRRNGKHHCMMNMADRQNALDKGTWIGSPLEKCPYCPSSVAVSHHNLIAVELSVRSCEPLFAHPAGLVQTESKWRIARDRSRQKRGPPSPSATLSVHI